MIWKNELINDAVLVAQFFYQCLNRFESWWIVNADAHLMVLNAASFFCSLCVVSKIKGMNLAVCANVLLHKRLEGKVIVRSNAVDQAFLLLNDQVGIANPFPPITKFSNSSLVLTDKVRFVVILIEKSHLFVSPVTTLLPRFDILVREGPIVVIGRHAADFLF